MLVLVTGDVLTETAVREFEEHDVAIVGKPADVDEDELVGSIEDVDGYIVGGNELVTERIIDTANRLKAVVFWGSHPETSFTPKALEKMRSRDIALETTGFSANAVAEMTVFVIGAALRDIPFLVSKVYSGEWVRSKGDEMGGKVLGIVGMGRVGQILAKKLSGFGLREIVYYDMRRNLAIEGELGVSFVELPELLSKSDIVSLHIPLLPQTKNLIGKDELKLMKQTAIFINTARPQLVDADALYEALSEGLISKAVFDGYYVYGGDFSLDSAGKLVTLPLTKFWFTPSAGLNTRENDIQQSEIAFELMMQVLGEQSTAA